jgi:hypothetical protein
MSWCSICSTYGLETPATTTREIFPIHSHGNREETPVCDPCAEEVDRIERLAYVANA